MVIALPLYDDNPTVRPPIVTLCLIGLCVGAFLWQLGNNEHQILYGYGMIPAVLFGSAHLAPALKVLPAWATLFTSMFLHGGWFHLIGNMVFLWIFGNNIEDVLGRTRYLALYMLCGVAAALVQALSSPPRMCRWSAPAGRSPASSAPICCSIRAPMCIVSSGS